MTSPNGDGDVARQRAADNNDDHHPRDHHQWTTFEVDIMLALICKGVHHKGIVEFATQFNEGLNGAGYGRQGRDVDMEAIQEILVYILDKKKAAVAFVERQTIPRVTRTQKRVFMRNIDFTGTRKEWVVDGRKKVEKVEYPKRIKRMLERKQREQFLRDFERRVEEQGQQRGETGQGRATRDEEPTSRVSNDFRYVRGDSVTAQSIMNGFEVSRRGWDGSTNVLDPRTPTSRLTNGSQRQGNTPVVPMPSQSANLPSQADNQAQGGDIHEVQAGLGTRTGLLDVSQSLSTSANTTLHRTSSRAHVNDPFRPAEEDGRSFTPYHIPAKETVRSKGQAGFAGEQFTTEPNGQPTPEGIPDSRESRQPRSDMTGRCTPLQAVSRGPEEIGGLSTAISWQSREDDRHRTFGMPDLDLNLATPFADLQAQPYHEESSYRNSRQETLAPADGRSRAPQPNVGHGAASRPRDLNY